MLKLLLLTGLSWAAHEPQVSGTIVKVEPRVSTATVEVAPQVITLRSDGENVWVADGDAEDVYVAVTDEVPPVWIGVRMVPVPEALAAHIGDEGMMVGNVVEGSPADKAGLERYDVLRVFAGQEIASGDELVEAINDSGAGKRVKVAVIRGGDEVTLRIKPGKRPSSMDLEYKYDEPELTEDATHYFGHNMFVTPDGNFQVHPLGQMHDLSDLLEDFEVGIDLGDLQNMQTFQFHTGQSNLPRLKMRAFPGMDFDSHMKFFANDFDGEGDIEIVIRSSDGENTMEISRNADGTFTVTRDGEDGERIEEYESLDQLEDEDGEAFEMFDGHGGQSKAMIFMQPNGQNLPRMQKDFSTAIERRIREAHERAAEARDGTERRVRRYRTSKDRAEQAQERAEEARKRVKRRVQKHVDRDSDDGEEREVKMMVRVTDDGVEVELVENGVRKLFEFDDVDHFRRSEPELFEKCEGLMD